MKAILSNLSFMPSAHFLCNTLDTLNTRMRFDHTWSKFQTLRISSKLTGKHTTLKSIANEWRISVIKCNKMHKMNFCCYKKGCHSCDACGWPCGRNNIDSAGYHRQSLQVTSMTSRSYSKAVNLTNGAQTISNLGNFRFSLLHLLLNKKGKV